MRNYFCEKLTNSWNSIEQVMIFDLFKTTELSYIEVRPSN